MFGYPEIIDVGVVTLDYYSLLFLLFLIYDSFNLISSYSYYIIYN